MTIGVVQLDVERLQAAQHGQADAAGRDGSHLHALEVVRALDAVGDVPAASHDPSVGGDVVAHQREDHHDDVLGDADRVRVGDLGDGDPAVDRRLQVDVVGADARGDGDLQIPRLGDPLGSEVGGPEGLGDHDVGVDELALEHRVGTVLVGGDDEAVPFPFEVRPQAQLARDATEQLPRREVDRLRRRCRLATGVRGDRGHAVTWIARSGIRQPGRRRARTGPLPLQPPCSQLWRVRG